MNQESGQEFELLANSLSCAEDFIIIRTIFKTSS